METRTVVKIGIVGCAGRMGRMLCAETIATEGAELIGGTEIPGNPHIGDDVALLAGAQDPSGLKVTDQPAALFKAADAIIDFTLPQAAIAHADMAADYAAALVIGTTGLEPRQQAAIDQAADRVPVVQAANMSLGVNLLLGLVRQVSGILDEDYDIEIVEMHHKHKVDAPSGTALALGREAAAARGVDLGSRAQRIRDGQIGERTPGDIGFATLRGGDVVGEHTVMFAGPGERIEITHKAASRAIFARGAIKAALWAADKLPGKYSMRDVLGMD